MSLVKIISGGQTGADRGGLDAAILLGIEHGGWCPYGRRAEDGRVPYKYALREVTTSDYPSRTRINIEESDGTVIFVMGAVTPGSRLTLALCKEMGKPHLVLRINNGIHFLARRLRYWLSLHSIRTLNVAGSRERTSPGIQEAVCNIIKFALQDHVRNGEVRYDYDEPDPLERREEENEPCYQGKLFSAEDRPPAISANDRHDGASTTRKPDIT